MSLPKYFLFCWLGCVLGEVLILLLHRLSRPRIRKRGCMPLAMAAALTLWRHWMGEVSYGLLLLPLFGALGAWFGNVGGEFFERYTRTGNAMNG